MSQLVRPGQRNLITDVGGLRVGNAHDARLRSGVTVLLPDKPVVAAIDVRGGGPGTRESDALSEAGIVEAIHGLALSGGSAFGLNAATGVQSYLKERNVGFEVGSARVPIVPQAILFDLLNGGDKDWGDRPPYENLAYQACQNAAETFEIGSAGAGYGATTERLKGGLGSASVAFEDGAIIGALAAVNAAGNVTVGTSPYFWSAPFELGDEFGGLGFPAELPEDALNPALKSGARESTTLCVVATNVSLTKTQARRFAIMAQTGLARAIYPVHTPLDGDIVYAISMGERPLEHPLWALGELGTHAANVIARAIARGVYKATGFQDDPHSISAYRDKYERC